MILAGKVVVNGKAVRELGTRVEAGKDQVLFEGRPVTVKKKLYVAVNKPAGYTCTRKDPHATRVVGELLPAEWTNLYTVGRLDRESEGLIFLTNDGEFCLRLTHPRFGIRKKYVATVEGRLKPGMLERFKAGVKLGDETLRIESGRIASTGQGAAIVELELGEGRYREIRRLFESEGLEVLRLVRVQIGPIKLGELKSGRWRALTPAELKTLLAPL